MLIGIWGRRRVISFGGALLVGGWLLGELIRELAGPELGAMSEPATRRMVTMAFIAFTVLAALPFVPGAEIGFALLVLSGGQLAPLVYFGMVGALTITYLTARLLPSAGLERVFGWLGLKKTSLLVANLDVLDPEQRMRSVAIILPSKVSQILLRHRYVLLAVSLYFPGNSVIGGGGGIAIIAGASRLFPFWHFLAVVSCAVAPMPLLFLFA